jgi:hypothetical protein
MGVLMTNKGRHPRVPEAPDRAAIAQWLDQISATTGDRRYRHAASILRAPRAGRPLCADDAAVSEIGWLISAGRAKKIEAAARMVATASADPRAVEASTRRLARKARAAARSS